MSFDVKVVLDSMAPCGRRLTTITATYPRFIHSEIMTHRDRERNAASSRAIPWEHKPGSKATTKSMKEMIITEPVIPIRWGAEQSGMQAGDQIPEKFRGLAEQIWLQARDNAVLLADQIHHIGRTYRQYCPDADLTAEELATKIHKSIPNRLTEPFMWITVVMTATEWNNFFRLRCHPDAEIHFQKIAGMIRDALSISVPAPLAAGEWHMPFVTGNDREQLQSDGYQLESLLEISTARVGRVSYLTHDGVRNPDKDIELFNRLADGSGFGHWSPHGHVAEASSELVRSGPFVGWKQFRKKFANENMEG